MDTELLVDEQIDDGRKLLYHLAAAGFEVSVAFWVRTREEGLRFLYIASPQVVRVPIAEVYRTAYAALGKLQNSSITISNIKLVKPDNPIATDAMAHRDRNSNRISTRYTGGRLGGLAVDEAYIYPRIEMGLDRAQILQTVTQLMNRTGALQPSFVTLRDGTSFRALPVGIQVQQPGDIIVVLHDVDRGRNQSLAIDEIVNIQ